MLYLIDLIKFYIKTYVCDPDKCPNCGKDACQTFCFRTTKKEQRATGLKWFRYWMASMRGDNNG